jgi:two-component system, OmpR family, sensor histidine kinase KdpD
MLLKSRGIDEGRAVTEAARKRFGRLPVTRAYAYIRATLAVAIAGLVAAAIKGILPLPNLSLVFLSAVLLVGVRLGTAPALYTAGLGFAVYNFCFTVPVYTFVVHDRGDLLTLLFFVLVAVLTGNLAGRVRSQLEAVRESERRTNILYDLARSLADTTTINEVLDTISRHTAMTFGVRSLAYLTRTDGPVEVMAVSTHPPDGGPSDEDKAAAERALQTRADTGYISVNSPATTYLFAPMRTGHQTIGLVSLVFSRGRIRLSAEQRQLLQALADQSAVAIERARLAADVEKARIQSETESLRTALLSSLSHDLRTPLSSIIGSATTLTSVWESLSPADRRELTDTILGESNRLNSLVQNLLDMTRIEHGGLEPRQDWADLREIVGRAVYRLRESLTRFRTVVRIGDDVPLLHIDSVLMEQVFVNILDNAAKHAPAASSITVTATNLVDTVEVSIEDEGSGIAPEDRSLVFDMFFRARRAETQTGGTGLGLSICKAFVEAHGGTIRAEAAATGVGTTIVVSLPTGELPPIEEEDVQGNGDADQR